MSLHYLKIICRKSKSIQMKNEKEIIISHSAFQEKKHHCFYRVYHIDGGGSIFMEMDAETASDCRYACAYQESFKCERKFLFSFFK